MRLESHR